MQNISLSFTDSLGRKVVCTRMDGGGDSFQLMIDNYYHCCIFYSNGNWQAHLNNEKALTLTADDIQIIGAIIFEKYPNCLS